MASDTGAIDLLSLSNLISESVKTVIAEYAAAGKPVPTLNTLAPGPFDNPVNASPAYAKAVRTIEAACAQLTFTVADPAHSIVNVSSLFLQLVSH